MAVHPAVGWLIGRRSITRFGRRVRSSVSVGLATGTVGAASSTAGSVPIVPTEADALSKAEAAGDYDATMAIKAQQIVRQIGLG